MKRLPMFDSALSGVRLEDQLPDAKPLYTPGQARAEAERCLYCSDAPCVRACPTEIDIPTFIKKIATDNVLGAARTILKQNILGYSCARVCPVEVLCVGSCVYNDWHREPIPIGKLQRFATETALEEEARGGPRIFTPKPAGPGARRVALVGAGPASLACAAYLALEGHRPVIFEKRALPGGLNSTGVAPYKLHLADALAEVSYVLSLGVELRQGAVGEGVSPEELLQEYDAIFLGLGLGEDNRLGIPGEDGPGVYGATAFIERLKTDQSLTLNGLRRALVVGGGNTAIDVARELAQLGVPDVAMVYRRERASMSGYAHEMAQARMEGVRLVERATPLAVLRDGERVRGLRVAISGPEAGEQDLLAEGIFLAIGQSKLRAVASLFPGVTLDSRGCVVVDPISRRTGNPKVYAGGDCINGGKEVVNAVADGREAARHMIQDWPTAEAA
ncbi:MAG: FAD-dependent oxidoreductase [Myxococcales bacterium]|nr:FAD-dependent oxidoreductase [Polyangiaceae bacterium]MDW8249515.1 FAD-dependent oxidoreductase [Myxococcales bacterium]